MDQLEKIDLIRERMGVTYLEAKMALEQNGDDVVEALIYLEAQSKKWDEKITGTGKKLNDTGKKLIDQINEIIKKGNVTKVRLKKGEKVILEIPATLGVVGVGGVLLSPILAVLAVVGTVAAFVNHYKLEIVRSDGKVEVRDLRFLMEDEEDIKEDNDDADKR